MLRWMLALVVVANLLFLAWSQHWLAPLGLDPQTPLAAAYVVKTVAAQASMLAFEDAFRLSGYAAFAMLPILLLLERPHHGAAPVAAH